jgi:NADH-quinone oxidoreductase subunit M
VGPYVALAAVCTIVAGAIYVLVAYQRIMLGTDKWQLEMNDASTRDHLILVPLISMTLFFGVHPAPILDLLEAPVIQLLSEIPGQ